MGGRGGRYQRVGCQVESSSACQGLRSRDGQCYAGAAQSLFLISWLARVQGKVAAHPAAHVPGKPQGTDPQRVCPPSLCRPQPGQGTPSPAHGIHLRHRYPGQRGRASHCGSSPGWQGGDQPKGKDPHHSHSQQAAEKTASVRP